MTDPAATQIELARLLALSPAERALALAAIEPAALRGELTALLASEAEAEATTYPGAVREAGPAVTSVNPDEAVKAAPRLAVHSTGLQGKRIGPYTLDAWIGDGGSASVYRAHRLVEGVRQTVAIKVLHRGLQAPEARQQFDRERRVLSVLEHASIARWIDGGVTRDGAAYLVLEFVDGQSITSFARARKLSLRSRIQLMIEVANAVDAAHRALIVHRDLKPGNLLVNEAGQIKLLDFGIAKLLEGDADQQTQVHMYTPAYAAPEQRSGGTITTATDVYAMGVILGELLTGKRFNSDITTTPSLQIDDDATEEGELPAPPARLRKMIKGDLDNILLKALAGDPNQRYSSAAAFADDLLRALDGRPVAAHPPSRWYRASKFVSRHKLSVALVTALSLGIVASSIVSVLFAISAERARERAELSFGASVQAVNDLTLDLAKQLREARGVRAETVASVLQKAQKLVSDIERTDPGNVALEQARIGMLIGFSGTYRSVARSAEANVALDDAWERLQALQQRGVDIPKPLVIDALLARSEANFYTMDWQACADDARQALSLSEGDRTRSWRARKQLASALFFANELQAVRALQSDALAIERTLAANELDADGLAYALDFYTTLASALAQLGEHQSAEALRVHARAATRDALRQYPNSVDLLLTTLRLVNLEANHLLRLERVDDAFASANAGLTQASEAIAANPNSTAFRLVAKALYNIRAQVFRLRRTPNQELDDLRAIRSLLRELSDRDPANGFLRGELSFAERRLANTLLLQSKARPESVTESETTTLAALQIDRELLAQAPMRPFARRYLAASLQQLGDLRRAQQRYEDADAAYQESLQLRLALAREFPDEASWRRLVAFSYAVIKDLDVERGDLVAATRAQREAASLWDSLLDAEPDPSTEFAWFDSQLLLLELLLAQGEEPTLKAEMTRLLDRLGDYAQQHAQTLQARPDLLKELARLEDRASSRGTR
ncbi:MAG TPA: serine/threonine-protein kinase [Xanthomonadales bacterium]|nr:serine/threonine-protein kinase [Xanthomonadales bacterium]